MKIKKTTYMNSHKSKKYISNKCPQNIGFPWIDVYCSWWATPRRGGKRRSATLTRRTSQKLYRYLCLPQYTKWLRFPIVFKIIPLILVYRHISGIRYAWKSVLYFNVRPLETLEEIIPTSYLWKTCICVW